MKATANHNRIGLFSYTPYLYIWGAQWMGSSLLQYLWQLDPNGTIRTVLLWAAVILSALFLWRGTGRGVTAATSAEPTSGAWLLPAAIAAALLVAAVLLVRLEVIPPLAAELLRAIILAMFYIGIGVLMGRELVYLGVWLLLLTAVIGIWYLGYAPIVLGFSAGASLIAVAKIFRFWGRTQR